MKTNNAITQEMIDDWKKEYGSVYRSKIGKQVFIWRMLNRNDYVSIMTAEYDNPDTKIFDRQDEIVRTVVLWPNNISALIADQGGIATTLADEVLTRAGFEMSETEEL